MSIFGYHLTLDCKGCNEGIKSAATIKTFTKQLVTDINMTAVGEPILMRLGEGPDLAGYSLVQLILTSNITAHFVDAGGYAYIDVFSCKLFAPQTVINCVHKFFEPLRMRHHYLIRDAR